MPEYNFDGIPGPTHNYSGLATGNIASEHNAGFAANPREAALQGLAKMCALAARGFPQAVLPPHERPDIPFLRTLAAILRLVRHTGLAVEGRRGVLQPRRTFRLGQALGHEGRGGLSRRLREL